MRFLRRPGTMPRRASQAGVLARPNGVAYTLGPHLESVEASVGNQDRGRGHVRTEREIPQTSREVGARDLGNCIAKPVGGQTAARFPSANGVCQSYLSSLRPVLAGSRSDPPPLGTSCCGEGRTAANVFRYACSQ